MIGKGIALALEHVTLKSRVLGCLLGGALGDAWGGAYEGKTGPLSFAVPARPVVSDDTQLTLATCEAIVERSCVEPASVASHLSRWFQAGRIRGIGSSTLKALRDLAGGTHWALAGARGEFTAGNGAAMRIAPLAFLLDPADSQHRVVIRDVCRITHHNDEAYAGALAVVLAIRSVTAGKWSQDHTFLHAAVDGLPDSTVRDRMEELLVLKLSRSDAASRFGATGVDSVPLALHCAQSIVWEPVQDVLSKTIRLGGDTDTIASIAGQLAGTVVGSHAALYELVAGIQGSDEVMTITDAFAEFVDGRDHSPSR